MLVACFENADNFDRPTRLRYAKVATAAVMVAALGRDMPTVPAPRVSGTALDPDDPLSNEWVVVVVGAHFAAALVARRRSADPGEPDERCYEYAITYDRGLVITAAQSLMQRIDSR